MGPSWRGCGPVQSKRRGPLDIEPSKWHSVDWSRNANGRDTLFLDDMTESAAVLDCPDMHNNLEAFPKLGVYRHREIATDNWLYLNDLTTTTQEM